ncbi:uncharacterized protein LOC127095833 [Lathyrus oleraceus]|uniref:uncharacterized protein LOC127095833 n=1 Tax=Pisum sativum TaxID=3888 RepID=UPI0021CF744E|nr:uncharacterized protein LOC127095833 [Pisum sativum]
MTNDDYMENFEELVIFLPDYNGVEVEGLKCIKFESGLCPKIKQFIGYQEILRFSMLVNKCRIYDEDSRAKFVHYMSASENKNGNQYHSKLYMTPANKGKQKFHKKIICGKETSGGGAPASLKCFMCGELGHHAAESMIDTSATHLLVSLDCIDKLNLKVTSMIGSVVFDTLTNVSVTTSLDDQMLVMFASLSVESDVVASVMPMVCEFPDVFPDDICIFPSEKEVKFPIDLVNHIRPVSMEPYRMSASKLSELKKKLKDLLEKKFLRPSVSPWGAFVLLVKKKDGSMRLCVDYR